MDQRRAGSGVDRDQGGASDGATGCGRGAGVRLHPQLGAELGAAMVPFKLMVGSEDSDSYLPVDELPKGRCTLNLSGTELREPLAGGRQTPSWSCSRPSPTRSPAAIPPSPAGVHAALHGAVRPGQVDHRQRPTGQIAREWAGAR